MPTGNIKLSLSFLVCYLFSFTLQGTSENTLHVYLVSVHDVTVGAVWFAMFRNATCAGDTKHSIVTG